MINRYPFFTFFILLLLTLVFMQTNVVAQGVTTAAINGIVADANGAPLPSANIIAVHTPSGTQYGTTSRIDGKYNLNGLRTGGPYSITVSFVGYKPQVSEGVMLQLGQNLKLDFTLYDEAVEFGDITVVGERSSILNSGKTGAVTSVTTEQIQSLPTINRSFQDFSKLSPLFSGSSLSAAGRNFKLNNIQIDGTQYNDLFGLGSTGTPGGQANANPISLDAIEEFQVVIAPYDVRLGGFTGGGVNAITRSGDNKLSGSIYGYGRNQDFVGKSPDVLKTKLSEFSEYQAGLRLGGPIMKDKLFFFVNAEMTKRNEPTQNVLLVGKDNLRLAADSLRTALLNYGYDPGTVDDVTLERPSLKLFARIDWNIGTNHTLTLRHNYVDADDDILPRSSAVNYSDRLYTFNSATHSSVLQFNSRFGNNLSNELIVGYTMIRDKREVGNAFPSIRVGSPISNIDMYAGTEEFSIANILDQDIIEFTDNFSIYSGNHVITVGTHNELFSFYNLFIRNFYGNYRFANVLSLIAGTPSAYEYRYSLTGNPRQSAEFSAIQLGGYIQDEWSLAPNFKLTFGARIDVPMFPDSPAKNDSVTKYFGGLGYGTEIVPDGNLLISPRVGFNWDVVGDKSSILRGGVGIFTGRVPYVWISNQYSNTGVEFADISVNNPSFFITDPNNQPKAGQNGLSAGSTTEIDMTDPDFKLPQVLRANIGLDQKLPLNFVGSFDFLYTKSINDPVYQDLNIKSPTGTMADGRSYYAGSRVASYFQRVMLLENTSDNYSTNVSAQIQGEPIQNIYLNLGYSGGIAKDKNSVVSSQARSQFRYNPVPNSPNDPPLTRSNFEIASRFFGSVSFSYEFFAQAKTTLTVFYNYQSGRPFSYVFNGDANQDGHDANDLIYIPKDMADLNAKYIFTNAGEDTKFMAYVARDEYLKNNKGKIAARNGAFEPWFDQIDLRLSQEIPFFFGREFELSFDILNFANLLNSEWGWLQQVPNQADGILRRTGNETSTGRVRVEFTDKENPFVNHPLLSRWQMQLGLRFTF